MRVKDIVIGEYYRIKITPDFGWVKPLKIFKPREYDKKINCILVECEHVVCKNDVLRIIRYFKPEKIIKDKYKHKDFAVYVNE